MFWREFLGRRRRRENSLSRVVRLWHWIGQWSVDALMFVRVWLVQLRNNDKNDVISRIKFAS